jgi:RND family efflux transporter MFP subunit
MERDDRERWGSLEEPPRTWGEATAPPRHTPSGPLSVPPSGGPVPRGVRRSVRPMTREEYLRMGGVVTPAPVEADLYRGDPAEFPTLDAFVMDPVDPDPFQPAAPSIPSQPLAIQAPTRTRTAPPPTPPAPPPAPTRTLPNELEELSRSRPRRGSGGMWPPLSFSGLGRGGGSGGWMKANVARVVIALALLVVVGVGAVLASGRLPGGTARVTIYTVHSDTLTSALGGGGLTFANQSLNVSYPVSARVVNVNVQVGQSVNAGDTLLTLDNADLTFQLQQAEAAWQAAESYLNTLYATPGTSPATIAYAQQLAEAAKGRYDALNAQLNSPAYSKGNILAPFAGVVTAVNVTSGSIAAPNGTLVTLQDESAIIVKAQFPLEQRGQIQVGQDAQVDPVATSGQTLPGKVIAINPQLTNNGSGTFEVWIAVQNADQQLFTGETVYARVTTQQTMLTIPELAVVNPDSDSIVFLYSQGRAHIRHVVIGARDGDRFGIVTGLQEGDQVILVGQHQLTDNQPVQVTGSK